VLKCATPFWANKKAQTEINLSGLGFFAFALRPVFIPVRNDGARYS
jgi:hypothetical protein